MEQDGLRECGVRICWGDDETAILSGCWVRHTSVKGGCKEENCKKGIVGTLKMVTDMTYSQMKI